MKKLLLALAFVPLSAPAAPPPCYYGLQSDAYDAYFPRIGQTGGVNWVGWICYPKQLPSDALGPQPPVAVFLAGTQSLGTLGTKLQAVRTAPSTAPSVWAANVKLDAKAAYPAAYLDFKRSIYASK